MTCAIFCDICREYWNTPKCARNYPKSMETYGKFPFLIHGVRNRLWCWTVKTKTKHGKFSISGIDTCKIYKKLTKCDNDLKRKYSIMQWMKLSIFVSLKIILASNGNRNSILIWFLWLLHSKYSRLFRFVFLFSFFHFPQLCYPGHYEHSKRQHAIRKKYHWAVHVEQAYPLN